MQTYLVIYMKYPLSRPVRDFLRPTLILQIVLILLVFRNVVHGQAVGISTQQVSGGLINPSAIAFSPVTGKVYSVDTAKDQVIVSDDKTHKTFGVKVGSGPVSIVVSTRSGKVYVTNAGDGTVSVLDGQTDAVLKTIKVSRSPYSICINSSTGKVYISHTYSNDTTIIDDQYGTVSSIQTGPKDMLAINEQTNTIYLLGYEGGDLSVIDGRSGTIKKLSAGMHAWGMSVNQLNGTLYVAKIGNAEVRTYASDGRPSATIPVGAIPCSIAIDAMRNRVFVANYGDSTVTLIDSVANKPMNTIAVGQRPEAVAVDPTRGLAFVANTQSDTVTVIDTIQQAVIATLDAGTHPFGLVFNPVSSKLHVVNMGEPAFTILNLPAINH